MAKYEGPICYVGHDHEAADGTTLEGGWHYSVEVDDAGGEHPDKKLYTDGDGTYRFAKADDLSHVEQHPHGLDDPGQLKLIAVDGALGDLRTPEEFEAAHRHLDELEQRLKDEGVHEQESDHILTTTEEIAVMRSWIEKAQS